MLNIGSLIEGKYRIISVIGRGGMSTVYLAKNEKVDKTWAIKEVKKDTKQNFEIVKQSLISEISMMKRLSHKGLPTIIDVLDYDDCFLIVMDYIEGVTLKEILIEEGPQDQTIVVEWMKQICSVLKYLHGRKPAIIYRDMKPGNIMLKKDGTVVLIDFGTAREYKDSSSEDTICLGTKGYAAPEQFGGQGQTDARTDIYCLGTTMYHLLTGHNPAKPPYEMYPITQWNQKLSSGLERIVLKCTQKNPDDRYQSVDELLHDLESYHDLDNFARKEYIKKTVVWGISVITSIALIFSGAVVNGKSKSKKVQDYRKCISEAQSARSDEDAIRKCVNAINIQPENKEAYQELLLYMMRDAVFTAEEEAILNMIFSSKDNIFYTFAKNNKIAYGDFCYNVGRMYWNMYERGKSYEQASQWIEIAKQIYEKESSRQKEYDECIFFLDLHMFQDELTIQKDGKNE